MIETSQFTMDLVTLFEVILLSLGISYVITGSLIGFPIRVIGNLATRRLPIPLKVLFFCPSCNAWWCGFFIAILIKLSWVNWLLCAFSSCIVAAMIQAQCNLAADDMEDIDKIFPMKTKGKDK